MARTKPVLAMLLVVGLAAAAVADTWTPNDFKGPAFYKYKVTQVDEDKVFTCALDIQASAQEGKYDVTTSVTTQMDASDLEGGGIWGTSSVLGVVPLMMLGNPMFAGLFGEVDLTVGSKRDMYGMAVMEVVGKETLAGVEGYRCELRMKDGDKMVKQAELTVHPDLALPMRSRVYDDGKLTFEMLLLEYRKH